MKTIYLSKRLGIAMVAVLSGEISAAAPAMRESLTHEQLMLARRKAELNDPMRHLPATQGEDPSVVNRPKSILAESDIVCFGDVAALVPKRAILQIPKNYADRIQLRPGAKLQSWSEFYAANRGWITTVEVSRIQAEGNEPLAEETKTQMTKSGNLIVATFLGGPISVLPLKVPVEKTSTPSKP